MTADFKAMDFYPRPPRGGRPTTSTPRTPANYFYPRPPRGGRLLLRRGRRHNPRFLSTPSARRATLTIPWYLRGEMDFYPRPPRGGRHRYIDVSRWQGNFYPRPPRGGRLKIVLYGDPRTKFLSTPSARRATVLLKTFPVSTSISIHALREEGDQKIHRPAREPRISIHALREEGDLDIRHSPFIYSISIHALREEGDSKNRDKISIFL